MHGDVVKLLENTLLEYETYSKNGVVRDDEGNVVTHGRIKSEWQNDNVTKKYKTQVGRHNVGASDSHSNAQNSAAEESQKRIDAENAKKSPEEREKEKLALAKKELLSYASNWGISASTVETYWSEEKGNPIKVKARLDKFKDDKAKAKTSARKNK